MVTVAAILLLAQASGGFTMRERQAAEGGVWDVLRDGRRVEVLDGARDVVLMDVFGATGDWRVPAEAARKMPPDSTAKQLYLAFLKKRFGYQIVALNRAYGLDASSFTELESEDFSRVAASRLESDDLDFAGEWLEEQLTAFQPQKPGRVLRLLVVSPTLPAALLERASKLVDGFAIRHTSTRPATTRPVLQLHASCAAVRPSWLTACVRISIP